MTIQYPTKRLDDERSDAHKRRVGRVLMETLLAAAG